MHIKIPDCHVHVLTVAFIAALFSAGCASTTPKAHFTQEITATAFIKATDKVQTTVTALPSLNILDVERTRITQRIDQQIALRKATNPGSQTRDVAVEVLITRYDKGSAFGRAMIAGLGQIHLDATVNLFTQPEHTQFGAFDIKKTFAWGGIYGASVTMEDIEATFADGLAAAVTGTKEAPKK